jgi:hypothetical protein
LLKKDEAAELRESLGGKFKILVHRDRDSLTEGEVERLKELYEIDGIRLWLTDQSDIEAEFCDPAFLSSLTGHSIHECEAWLDEIQLHNRTPIRDQFTKQRAAHNEEFHKAGGSPTNEDVWAALQAQPLKGATGKHVFKQLKNKVPANGFSEAKIAAHTNFPERAASLKANLQDLLA